MPTRARYTLPATASILHGPDLPAPSYRHDLLLDAALTAAGAARCGPTCPAAPGCSLRLIAGIRAVGFAPFSPLGHCHLGPVSLFFQNENKNKNKKK